MSEKMNVNKTRSWKDDNNNKFYRKIGNKTNYITSPPKIAYE